MITLHIGVDDYRGKADLKGCINDCRKWQKLCISRGYHTARLENRSVTLPNVLDLINAYVTYCNRGTPVLITYSGHGSLTYDTSNDEDTYDEAWVMSDHKLLLDDYLRKELNRLQPGSNFAIISDSCHSGTMTRSTTSSRQWPDTQPLKPDSKKLRSIAKDPEELLLSACSSSELAQEQTYLGIPHGAFTYNAISFLDANITANWLALHRYTSQTCKRRYNQQPQLESHARYHTSPVLR